jgi:ribosomal-protein-alanine N-acetyltransferase
VNRLVLETKRLTLRPLEARDAVDLHRLINDPEIARNTLRIPYPYPADLAEEWIAKHQKELGETDEAVWAITLRETGELMGIIGIVPKPFDVAEIGYWLARAYWGRGYASEAAAQVIRYGFETRTFNRIEATVFSYNAASARVVEKCGMTFEGLHRQGVRKGEEYIDVRMYSILKSEFQRSFQRHYQR